MKELGSGIFIPDNVEAGVSSESESIGMYMPLDSYEDKLELLKRLDKRRGRLNSRKFVGLVGNKKGKAGYGVTMFTEANANLTVTLTRNGAGGKLSVSGSPMKLLTDQNVVNLPSDYVERSTDKLVGWYTAPMQLLADLVEDCLDVQFFTDEEAAKISAGDIPVWGIGYTFYQDMGERKTDKMAFLAFMATKVVTVEGAQRQLVSFLKVRGYSWDAKEDKRTEVVAGFRGKKRLTNMIASSGVLLVKSPSGVNKFSMLFYDKEEELKVKGSKESRALAATYNMEGMVRVDLMLYDPGIRQLLRTGDAPATLREVVDKFRSDEAKFALVSRVSDELGMHILTGGPTYKELASLIKTQNPKIFEEWEASTVVVQGRSLKSDFELGAGTNARRRVEKILKAKNASLLLPPVFYRARWNAIGEACTTVKEWEVLEAVQAGDADVRLLEDIYSKKRAQASNLMKVMRITGNPEPTKLMKKSLK
jgi:hypothetical protein